jgi:hypothetical protein
VNALDKECFQAKDVVPVEELAISWVDECEVLPGGHLCSKFLVMKVLEV